MILTAFVNLSLNKGTREHLYTKNFEHLYTYLKTHYDTFAIENSNYRINGNICIVSLEKLPQRVKEGLDSVTYIIEESESNEPQYFRCFYVDSVIFQSGKAIIQLSVDLWTSFIFQADLTLHSVSRCNRNLLWGIYDDVNAVNPFRVLDNQFNSFVPLGGVSTADPSINTLTTSQVSVVLVVSCVVAQRVAGTDQTEAIFLVCSPLKQLVDKAVALDSTLASRYKPVEIAQRVLSGVYSMPSNFWFVNTDIKILKAYVLPNEVIKILRDAQGNTYGIVANFKSVFNPTQEEKEEMHQISLAYVNAGTINKVSTFYTEDLDLNKKYICGVRDKGIDLLRTTEYQQQVQYEFALNNDGLHAVVKQGDKSLDITSSFEISLIGEAQDTDALQRIAQSMDYSSKILGTYKGLTGETPLSGVQSALGLSKLLDNRSKCSASVSNDDGFATYYLNSADLTLVRYPLMLTYWLSMLDEEVNARENGATFNRSFNAGIEQVFNKDLLGARGTNLTFIKAEAEVTNVCENACEFIANEFARGIYIHNVEDEFETEDED